MEFLGMGTGEILVILVIALIVFGPERLVGIARTLGKISHQVTQAGRDFNRQLQREINLDELGRKDPKSPDNRNVIRPGTEPPVQPVQREINSDPQPQKGAKQPENRSDNKPDTGQP